MSVPPPPAMRSSPSPPLIVSAPPRPLRTSSPPLPLRTLSTWLPVITSSPVFEPDTFSKFEKTSASAPLIWTVPEPVSSSVTTVPAGVAVRRSVSTPSPPSNTSAPPKEWIASSPAPPSMMLKSLFPRSVSSKSVPTIFSKSTRVRTVSPSTSTTPS